MRSENKTTDEQNDIVRIKTNDMPPYREHVRTEDKRNRRQHLASTRLLKPTLAPSENLWRRENEDRGL